MSKFKERCESTIEKALKEINRPRTENTSRRASMADSARNAAYNKMYIAKVGIAIDENPDQSYILAKCKSLTLLETLYGYRHRSNKVHPKDLELTSFAEWQRDVYQKRSKAFIKAGIVDSQTLELAVNEVVRLYNQSSTANKEPDWVSKEKKLAFTSGVGIDFFPTSIPESNRLGGLVATYTDGDITKLKCLDAGAGTGHLSLGLVNAGFSKENITAVELSSTLVEILNGKGFSTVHGDFLEFASKSTERHDIIVTNPPFGTVGNRTDIAFIKSCYNLLNDGGLLMGIVSSGTINNTLRESKAFVEWLNSVGYLEMQDMPEDSFNHSSCLVKTNAKAVYFLIRK